MKSANLLAENYNSQTNFTHAQQNTNVVYGTWSFDWIVSDDKRSYDVVEFIFTDHKDNYNWTGQRLSTLQFTGYSLRMISYLDGYHGRGMDLLKY
ncbi:MAG: hypothetical protein HeimC2_45300 [Candidatus Heimdallarchaeota archaeon LC_2]|nr:MAG: hypothetical protein HeimC2_45300 [Candidatus Heimdallarchaeota archaeon LC_2]